MTFVMLKYDFAQVSAFIFQQTQIFVLQLSNPKQKSPISLSQWGIFDR
jgi:hypothetical protein